MTAPSRDHGDDALNALQRALDALKAEREALRYASPVLTRLADGRRFVITLQARSPDGPCQLRGIDPPHEVVETRNDLLDRDFADPRKSQRMPAVAPGLLPPQTFAVSVPAEHAEKLRQFVAALGGEVAA